MASNTEFSIVIGTQLDVDGVSKDIAKLNKETNTVKFSADVSDVQKEINNLRNELSKNPIKISFTADSLKSNTSIKNTVKQIQNDISNGIKEVGKPANSKIDISDSVKFDSNKIINVDAAKNNINTIIREINKLQTEIKKTGGTNFSASNIKLDTKSGDYSAVIKYNTSLGETVSYMIRLSEETGEASIEQIRLSTNMDKVAASAKKLEGYTSRLNKLRAQSEKAGLLSGTEDTNSYLKQLNQIDFSQDAIGGSQENLNRMISLLEAAEAKYKEFNAAVNKKWEESSIEHMSRSLIDMSTNIDIIENKFKEIGLPDDISLKINDLRNSLAQIQSIDEPSEKITSYNALSDSLKQLETDYKAYSQTQKESAKNAADEQRAYNRLLQLRSRYKALGESNNAALVFDNKLSAQYTQIGRTLDSLFAQYNANVSSGGKTTKEFMQQLQTVGAQMSSFSNESRAAGLNVSSFSSSVKDAVSQLGSLVSISSVFLTAVRGFRDIVSNVKDVNASMTDLKKVTDETEAGYDRFLNSVSQRAFDLRTEVTDLIDATTNFSRMGYDLSDATELGEAATIYMNVGDEVDSIDDATNSIISTMHAFGIEADNVMTIVDKFNYVGNNFAITSGGIGEALQRSASALDASNLSLEKSIALITTANTVVSDPASVGTGLKTLTARIRGAETDLQEMGEETDEFTASTSKMREEIMKLTGVDIMIDDSTFKDVYDILGEISDVYGELTDTSQANLLEMLFGKRQANIGSAILSNFDIAREALTELEAMSEGSAMKEYSTFMDSIEASQNKLTASIQRFSTVLLDSELVSFTYNAGSGIIGFLTEVIELFGAIPSVITAATAAITAFKGSGFVDISKAFADFKNNGISGNTIKSLFSPLIGTSKDALVSGSVEYINAYNEALKGTEAQYRAVMDSAVEYDAQLYNYLGSLKGATASTEGYSAALKGVTIASKAANFAVKALNVALNAGIALIVSWGISKIVEGIDNAIHAEERLKEELQEQTDESVSNYKEVQKKLEDVESELEDISVQIEDLEGKKLSFVEQEELDKLIEQKETLEDTLEIERELAEIKGREASEAITKEYQSEFGTSILENQEFGTTRQSLLNYTASSFYAYKNGNKTENDIQSLFKSYSDEYKELFEDLDIDFDENGDIESILSALEDYLLVEYGELKDYASRFEEVGVEVPFNIQQSMDNIVASLSPAQRKQESFDSIWNDTEKISESTKSDLLELALRGELTGDVLKSQFKDVADALYEVGIDANDAANQISSMATSTTQTGVVVADFSTAAKELSNLSESYELLNSVISEQAESGSISVATFDELTSKFPELSSALELTATGWKINEDAVYSYIEAEGEALRSDAISHIAELQEKLDEAQTYINVLGDSYYNLSDEQRGFYDEQSALVSQLQQEINSYQLLVDEIDSATSAYARWQTAKETENQDAVFNEGTDMYETIKEGRSTLKTGTDDFQSAVDFMLGTDWESRYSDSQSAYKAAEEIGSRYFGQEDERQGMLNFAKDLAENYDAASWDGDELFLDTTASIEGMAEAMGMSEDAIRSLFGLMETYEINFDWFEKLSPEEVSQMDYSETTSKLDQYKQKLQELYATDTSGMSDEELENFNNSVNNTLENIVLLEDQLENLNAGTVAPETEVEMSPLEQLKQTLTDVQTTITALNENGISIPVSLTGQADVLQTMITALTGAETLLLNADISAEDAEATCSQISNAIELVKANPNISTTLSATLTEAGESAIAEIQEAVALNGQTATVNAKIVASGVEGAKAAIENAVDNNDAGYIATITANADTEQADSDLDAVANKDRTTTITVQYADEDGNKIEQDFEYVDNTTKNEDGKTVGFSGVIPGSVKKEVVKEATPTTSPATVEVKTEVVSNNSKSITDDIQKQIDSEHPAEVPVEIDKDAFEMDFSSWEDFDKFSRDLLSSYYELQNLGDNAGIDTSGLSNAATELFSAIAQFRNTDPADVTAYETASNQLSTAVYNFSSAYTELRNNLQTIPDVDVNVNANTTAASNAIDNLSKKTVTVRVIANTSGIGYASGTNKAPSGMALVDEEGAELIEHTKRGVYELGTNNGPRFTKLEAGDVVHTAEETKKILKRGGLLNFTKTIGRAFKNGTVKVGRAFATYVSGSASFANIISSLVSSSSSSSSKKNSSSKKSAKKLKETFDSLFDWIEVRMDRLQTITDRYLRDVDESIGYIAKNNDLENALSSVNDQIEAAMAGYERYMKQANSVSLTAGTIKKIQEGTIDIQSYTDSQQDRINEYQKWYDKAQDLLDTLYDLRDTQQEIVSQKLDSIIDHYNYRIDRLDFVVDQSATEIDLKTASGVEIIPDDYADSIDATLEKISLLQEQRNTLNSEFESLINRGLVQEGSEVWYDYTEQLEDLDITILETKQDMIDLQDAANNIKLTNLSYQLSQLENSADVISKFMDLHEAQGMEAVAEDYNDLILNGMEQIANLEAQNVELKKQQQGLDIFSEKYQDIQEQINNNASAIMDIKTSQEEWNDAILDININRIQDYIDELNKVNDAYQRQKDLQEAIENLEKAKSQRTQRIYREDIGFVYEADQDAIKEAQDNLNQKYQDEVINKLDDLINAIEDSKSDTNVYDALGNLLGTQYVLPDIAALLEGNTGVQNILETFIDDTAKSVGTNYVTNNGASVTIPNISITMNGVNDPETFWTQLGEGLDMQLSNALLQGIYKK